MASTFIRSVTRTSISSLRTHIPKSKPTSFGFAAKPTASPSPAGRFASLSRTPVELAACSGSMYPLHSAVAAARLTSRLSSTSRSCRDLSQGTRTYPGL